MRWYFLISDFYLCSASWLKVSSPGQVYFNFQSSGTRSWSTFLSGHSLASSSEASSCRWYTAICLWTRSPLFDSKLMSFKHSGCPDFGKKNIGLCSYIQVIYESSLQSIQLSTVVTFQGHLLQLSSPFATFSHMVQISHDAGEATRATLMHASQLSQFLENCSETFPLTWLIYFISSLKMGKLLWFAMTWYFISASERSCFPQWWQVNISCLQFPCVSLSPLWGYCLAGRTGDTAFIHNF